MKPNKKDPGYFIIISLLVVTSIFSISLFFRENKASDKLNISIFPSKFNGWSSKDMTVTEKEYGMLETRNLLLREYKNQSGDKIFLFIIYSETNRSVFHPPEVCLIGEGVTIENRQTEKIAGDKYSFVTNKLNLEKNKVKEIVLYCYKAGNFYTDNYYIQQTYLALHQIFGRRVPGATIRVSMSLKGGEKETLAALKNFMSQTVKIMDHLSP